MNQIGFKPPENPDETLEVEKNGHVFILKKARQKNGSVIYSCERKDRNSGPVTGFQTDQDLNLVDLVTRPQFVEFMA